MKNRYAALFVVSALTVLAANASADPLKKEGGMVVDSKGMTVYTFDKDVAGSGKSVCNDACATIWPPAYASASDKASGDATVITRDDGKKQWAYKGKPVYLYAKDMKKGDMTGDNFKDVWHVAK